MKSKCTVYHIASVYTPITYIHTNIPAYVYIHAHMCRYNDTTFLSHHNIEMALDS